MNFVILFVACININGVTNSPAQVWLKVSVVLEQVGFFFLIWVIEISMQGLKKVWI